MHEHKRRWTHKLHLGMHGIPKRRRYDFNKGTWTTDGVHKYERWTNNRSRSELKDFWPEIPKDIDRMTQKDAKRFNDATLAEVNRMKKKGVMELRTLDSLPFPTKVYQSVVNWTSKTNLGVYVKTKCRICFGGHRYDKSSSDTFAPTVNFCTVLIIICLSKMFSCTLEAWTIPKHT